MQDVSGLAGDWLLITGRNFYNWAGWCAAADTGAALLWRVKADLTVPVLELLPDGSYLSVLVSPAVRGTARQALIDAARDGQDLDPGKARRIRVIEYEVPGRGGGTGQHCPRRTQNRLTGDGQQPRPC